MGRTRPPPPDDYVMPEGRPEAPVEPPLMDARPRKTTKRQNRNQGKVLLGGAVRIYEPSVDVSALLLEAVVAAPPSEAKTGGCHARVYGGEYKLTAQEEAFSQTVAQGFSLSEAYRRCYRSDPNEPRARLYVRASTLASKDKIKGRIQVLIKEKEKWITAQATGRAERILDFLEQNMTDDALDIRHRIKSAELLGRSVGLFTPSKDKAEKPIKQSLAELEEQLQRKLGALKDVTPVK